MIFDPKQPYDVPQLKRGALKEAENFSRGELLKAHVAIAKIEGFTHGVPESQSALFNPIYLKEALESSEIENINTTLLEVLQQQLNPSLKKRDNSQLVVNYFFALLWGVQNVKKVGLSSRLIRGLHHQLLPTEHDDYRRLPVAIGDGRGVIRYTPPEAQHLPRLIREWENLVNKNPGADPIVLAAAAHYQFEAIHPFEDGNGRTGRLLLTLQLVKAGLLSAPVIHISQYINSNRPEYYRLLRNATESGDLNSFVKYLVKGFALQARHSYSLLRRIQSLRREYQTKIRYGNPSLHSSELVEAIFNRPVQSPVQLAKDIGVHYVTASKYLKELAKLGYLDTHKHGRHVYYINKKMFVLLEEKGRTRFENE